MSKATKRQVGGKQNGDITLGNVKGGIAQHHNIRQIKDMGSNPGSRVGSQKAANVRAGDQTTIIKKQYINPAGNQAAAVGFVAPGSMVRGAPKIGLGAPTIIKTGNGTARGGVVVREGGSQGRVQKVTMGPQNNGGGSHGAIKTTTQPMGGQKQYRAKKGSCNAIIQRGNANNGTATSGIENSTDAS